MENTVYLHRQAMILVQALLGVISPNFRMIWLNTINETLWINIVLEKNNSDDIEEIEDLKTEFEALQSTSIDYEFKVKITDKILDWPDGESIVVYRRREF